MESCFVSHHREHSQSFHNHDPKPVKVTMVDLLRSYQVRAFDPFMCATKPPACSSKWTSKLACPVKPEHLLRCVRPWSSHPVASNTYVPSRIPFPLPASPTLDVSLVHLMTHHLKSLDEEPSHGIDLTWSNKISMVMKHSTDQARWILCTGAWNLWTMAATPLSWLSDTIPHVCWMLIQWFIPEA